MRLREFIYIMFIVVTAISCEPKIVEFDMPDDSDKLAVFGFLSPGDTVTNIYVRPFLPNVIVNPPVALYDVNVKITHDGNEHLLKFDTMYNAYSIKSSELSIRGGETYSLEVSAEGYKTVSSTIRVISEENKTLKFIKLIKRTRDYGTSIAVKWQDNPSVENFYVLSMIVTSNNHEQTFGYTNSVTYSDANWNGEEKYSKDLYLNYYSDFVDPSDSSQIRKLSIALINADKHYYMYHKKASEQNYFMDNPFAEPVIVYSNIKNGAGVFCSYTKYVVDVNLK